MLIRSYQGKTIKASQNECVKPKQTIVKSCKKGSQQYSHFGTAHPAPELNYNVAGSIAGGSAHGFGSYQAFEPSSQCAARPEQTLDSSADLVLAEYRHAY